MRKPIFLLLAATAAVASTFAFRDRSPGFTADLPATAPSISSRPASAPVWTDAHSPSMQSDVANPAPTKPRTYSESRGPELSKSTGPPAAVVGSTSSSVARASLSRRAPDRRPVQAPQTGPTIATAASQNSQSPVASGFSLGNISNPAPSLAVELDRGVQLPIALLEDAAPITPLQAAVKQQIAKDFAERINEAIAQGQTDPKSLDEFWDRAQGWANWEYQKFFGSAAANRAGMQAGVEALAVP